MTWLAVSLCLCVVGLIVGVTAWDMLHDDRWIVRYVSSSVSLWRYRRGALRDVAVQPGPLGIAAAEAYRFGEVRISPTDDGRDYRLLDPPTPTWRRIARWRVWVAREVPWLT